MQSHHNLYFQGLRREKESSSSSKGIAVKPKGRPRGKQREREEKQMSRRKRNTIFVPTLLYRHIGKIESEEKILPAAPKPVPEHTDTSSALEKEMEPSPSQQPSSPWCCVTERVSGMLTRLRSVVQRGDKQRSHPRGWMRADRVGRWVQPPANPSIAPECQHIQHGPRQRVWS